MARIRLTAGRIRDFTCAPGKKQSFLWDSEAPGLALRVTPNGSKAFIYQGKLNGEAIRITIGDIRTWTIDAAQTEARRQQTFIDKGLDPRQQAEEQRVKVEAAQAKAKRKVSLTADAWADFCLT